MIVNDLPNDRSFKLMHSFWNMQRNIMNHVQKIAAKNRLSVTQYNILMMLTHYGDIPQKILQEKAFLPKSTLSQAINGLVDYGYVTRQQIKGNRREIKLTICEDGRLFMEKINAQENSVNQLYQNAVDSLTDQQLTDVIKIQQQIAANFEDKGNDTLC